MLLRKIAAVLRLKPFFNMGETAKAAPIPTGNLALTHQINLKYLREMAMGDEDFVIEIINMFIEQTPDNLNKLSGFTRNHQWKEVRELAHKMKYSMVMIGIKELEDIFVNIQLYTATPGKTALIQPMVLRAQQISEIAFKDLKAELKVLENQPVQVK